MARPGEALGDEAELIGAITATGALYRDLATITAALLESFAV
jgi:hypothetical protein